MTRSVSGLLTLLFLVGCATLRSLTDSGEDRLDLWAFAQQALAREEFDRAEAYFTRLATDHPDSVEGRESLFYIGSLRLDPRNPDWDPGIAEERLAEYLMHMDERGPRLYRYPEAISLHEIARQLNLPPGSRIVGLQPEDRVITIEERVVVPAEQSRELMAEVVRLRAQIAARDSTIRAQADELERIRRTLTGPGRASDQRN